MTDLLTKRQPLTLGERRLRGWLEGYRPGWPSAIPPATKASLTTLYDQEAAIPRVCRGCRQETTHNWHPYNNGRFLTVFYECKNCGETWEV